MSDQNTNRVNKQELLDRIYALDFAISDLKLFLDTHPCNEEALSLYRKWVEENTSLKETYTAFFGPLMAETYVPGNYWAWIEDPWPWSTPY